MFSKRDLKHGNEGEVYIKNYRIVRVQFPEHRYVSNSKGLIDVYRLTKNNHTSKAVLRAVIYQDSYRVLLVNPDGSSSDYGHLDRINYLIRLKQYKVPDYLIKALDKYINECREYERGLGLYSRQE